jgi:hypothetical protein
MLKLRKSNVPFSTLLGPKCVRFADVVNNNICLVKRRRNVVPQDSNSGEQISSSSAIPVRGGAVLERVGAEAVGQSKLEDEEIVMSTAE